MSRKEIESVKLSELEFDELNSLGFYDENVKFDYVYYAHNIRDYGTEFEENAVRVIEQKLGPVCNPNSEEHQEGYHLKKMRYFFTEVIPKCDALVFTECSNGKVGYGVFSEIKLALEREMPVFHLDRNLRLTTLEDFHFDIMNIEETRDFNNS